MDSKKEILYLGNDIVFYNEINEITQIALKNDQFETIKLIEYSSSTWQEMFCTYLDTNAPQLIFFDFSTLEQDEVLTFFSTWSFLIRFKNFSSIAIVGIFKNKEQLTLNRTYFSQGIVLSFIKGMSLNTLFNDSYYITYEEAFSLPQYATAKQLNLTYKIGFPSCISNLNLENITLDSDLNLEVGSIVAIDFNLFPEFKAPEFEIRSIAEARSHKNLYSLEIKMPYAAPWDTNSDCSLERSTVETWIDFNTKNLLIANNNILIVNNEYSFIKEVAQKISNYQILNLFCVESINNKLEFVESLLPSVIIFQLEESEGDQNNLSSLDLLFKRIKQIIDYDPIIFLFNTNSTSTALQKLFSYKKIISVIKSLNIAECISIISIYEKNVKSNQELIENYFINKNSPLKYAEIFIDVQIYSLTEHELVFYSERDFPLFSVIKLDIPVEIFLTIIPHLLKSPSDLPGKCYLAIIHGVEEKDLGILRRFVNQMLHSPPSTFEYYPENNTKIANISPEKKQEVESNQDIIKLKQEKIQFTRKQRKKGFSKL